MIDPESDQMTGYHLFLMPAGALAGELSAVIRNLAQEFGGPLFPPHVTVSARVYSNDEAHLVQKVTDFARSCTPFELSLGLLSMDDTYFRALYAVVDQQDQLRDMHSAASAALSMEPDSGYKAHLSLLYGNYPHEAKEVAANGIKLPQESRFSVHSLHLYKTEGAVESWYEVGEYPFGG